MYQPNITIFRRILLSLSIYFCVVNLFGQDTVRNAANTTVSDTILNESETVVIDTVRIPVDSVAIDTALVGKTKEFDDSEARRGKIYWDSHLRLRHEYWDNQEDLNDDLDDLYSFTRLKLHLGGGIRPSKHTELYARFINESRFYGHKGTGDSIENDHFWKPERYYFEVVIGQLYFRWKNIANDRLDITIGRQNLHNQGFGNQ